MSAESILDRALEIPVVPSFSRIGYALRSRAAGWTPLSSYRLEGRTIVLTGATSGIGRAAAEVLAGCGATMVVVGRDARKTATTRDEIAAATGNDDVQTVVADLADLAATTEAAAELLDRFPRIDALVHNAGALHDERRITADGIEATVAISVVAPFLLTSLLLDRLRASAPSRVVTMSSGGMYTAPLTVDDLEMDADTYRGAEQYARAKRAQVTINEMWAAGVDRTAVAFHALHPGWADTPGVVASLPTFRKLAGPLLRSPEQGADTMCWLVADDGEPLASTGEFWHDRRRRPIHRLSRTRRSDTPARRRALWDWCIDRAGTDAPSLDRGVGP